MYNTRVIGITIISHSNSNILTAFFFFLSTLSNRNFFQEYL